MKTEEFMQLVIDSHSRCVELLVQKGLERTTEDGDRLGNFKTSAKLRNQTPAESLADMCSKQFADVLDWSHHPKDFSPSQWIDRLDDVKNYMFLLEGVLTEMGVL